MSEEYDLAIFEAGISQVGEMALLENIIKPTLGVLTNIGEAHNAGFESRQQKLEEKWKLFENASAVICNGDDKLIEGIASGQNNVEIFTWAYTPSPLQILDVKKHGKYSIITAHHNNQSISISIPFTDNASIENAITCWCVMLYLGINHQVIGQRMRKLEAIEMRLELKKAINSCSIINDSYSNDLSSLEIALDFLQQQAGNQKATVILSDLGEASSSEEQYQRVVRSLAQHKVEKFIGIGPRLFACEATFSQSLPEVHTYLTVEDFMHQFSALGFKNETILLKGARVFEFERIDLLFAQQVHQTLMEVNLSAMVQNLKEYQRFLKPSTKIMAMVKAFSYGSGKAEVANALQYHKVDYLAVAYADEGVELRKAGIKMPIMVMNPEPVTFQALLKYSLEPEIYSFGILHEFAEYVKTATDQQFPVHIKLDTGMHRLGFEATNIEALCTDLTRFRQLNVRSVFSHLAGSEDNEHDAFTTQQVEAFLRGCDALETALAYPFLKHIANSAAIFRHPGYQFDMVRLGIGLYGVDSTAQKQLQLIPVATLRTTIAQLREVKKGDSIGYSRKGIMKNDGRIATIRIGYADGYRRTLSNGAGKVWIKGNLAPVIGNVCMDMTMVDVSAIEGIEEGDTVEVFGPHLPLEQIAKWSNTIPYEIMTTISQRVKRVYYEE
jgi:alanine racemase